MTAPSAPGSAPPPPQSTTADPPPMAPQKPLPFDCCESGCDRCVYDIYADELTHYQCALTAWRDRHPGRDPGADAG